MRLRLAALCLATATAAATAAPALAETPEMRAALAAGTCFRRDYDAAHLARHPAQRVTMIGLVRDSAAPGAGALVLLVALAFRDSDEVFTGSAYCETGAGGLACGMEGDAGAFTLTGTDDGALRLAVDARGMGFEGATGFESISGTSGDDRLFRLPVAATNRCAFLR